MKAIVAVDRNWGIGKDGQLLVRLPGDMKYFKEKTIGKIVVMGRATLESLPGAKPLPERTNIVLSRNPDFSADCAVCSSQEHLLSELIGSKSEDIYVIGGAEIYKTLLPYCDTVYVTKIDGEFPADSYYENLDDNEEWELVFTGERREEKEIAYYFTEYRRKSL